MALTRFFPSTYPIPHQSQSMLARHDGFQIGGSNIDHVDQGEAEQRAVFEVFYLRSEDCAATLRLESRRATHETPLRSDSNWHMIKRMPEESCC